MVSVKLEDNKTCWFDKNAWEFQTVESVRSNYLQRFGYRHPRMPSLQVIKRHRVRSDLSDSEVIEKASLGSAAIPLAFEPIEIPLEQGTFNIIDGGLRDVLPSQACISQLKSEASDVRIVSIYCSPLSGYHSPYSKDAYKGFEVQSNSSPENWGENVLENKKNIVDIALRSTDMLRKEVEDTDIYDPFVNSFETGQDIKSTIIAPSFSINSPIQIDPGLIRIQLAYGWMRAYDRVNDSDEHDSYENTDRIIRLRMLAWRNETRFYSDLLLNQQWYDDAISVIRKIKKELRKELVKRINKFGVNSLPMDLHDAKYDDGWYMDFERHGVDYGVPQGTPWMNFERYFIPPIDGEEGFITQYEDVPSVNRPARLRTFVQSTAKITIQGKLVVDDEDTFSSFERSEVEVSENYTVKTGELIVISPLMHTCTDGEVQGVIRATLTGLWSGDVLVRLLYELYTDCSDSNKRQGSNDSTKTFNTFVLSLDPDRSEPDERSRNEEHKIFRNSGIADDNPNNMTATLSVSISSS